MEGKGNNFLDDPEWQELRRQVEGQRPSKIKPATRQRLKQLEPEKATTPKVEASPKEISIKLSVPKLKMPALPKLPRIKELSRWQQVVGGTLIVLVMGLLGFSLLRTNGSKSGKESTGVLSDSSQQPGFVPVLPKGDKTQITSPKVAYDADKKVVSFTDTIDGIDITVSEQPLPDSFKSDPDGQVEKVAQSFSANEVIYPSNPKTFLGTSAKGPQTVILQKKGLLIFIYSNRSIDKDSWTEYVRLLL